MSITLYPSVAKVKRNNVYQNLPGFVQQSGDADIEAMLANKETSSTAQYNHDKGTYFILNDVLYEATDNIPVNGTIAVGTNCKVAILGNDIASQAKKIDSLNSTVIEINNGNKDCLLQAKFYDGYYNGSDVYTGSKTETLGQYWGVVVVPVPVGETITISGFSGVNGTHSCWLNSSDPSDVNSFAWSSNQNNGTKNCKTAWLGISDYNYIGTKDDLKVIYGEIDEINNRIDDNKSKINTLLYENPLDGIANVSHQLLKSENATNGYYYTISNGKLIKGGEGTANSSIFEAIPVEGGKTYYVKNVYGYFCILDDGGTLSQLTSNTTSAYTGTFTPTNNGFIYITLNSGAPAPNILTDGPYTSRVTQSDDVFNASLIIDGYIHLKISPSGGDYTDPITAVRNITDASETKQYMLDVYPGTYHLEDAITSAEQQGSIWGLKLPNYVHMRGIGERDDIILDCSLDDDASSTAVQNTSTINLNSNNSLENLTFTGRNVRYVVHDESSNSIKNWKRIVKNCKFVHNGNAEGFWAYTDAWGEGCSSGSYSYFEDCIFINKSYVPPFKFHTNTSFESACTHIFKNCQFIQDYYGNDTSGSFGIVDIQCGKPINVEFVGCSFSTFIFVENQNSSTDIEELNITGNGNTPVFLYVYLPSVSNPSTKFAKFTDEVALVYNATNDTIAKGKCVRHWNYTRNQVGIETVDGTGVFGIALEDIPSHELGYVKYAGLLSTSTVGITGINLYDRIGVNNGDPAAVTDGKYFARAIQNNVIEFC